MDHITGVFIQDICQICYEGHNDNRDWQKIIGSSPTKQEADKKMLQKVKQIGDFIDSLCGQGKSTNKSLAAIQVLLANLLKSKKILTEIDKLLKINQQDSTVAS